MGVAFALVLAAVGRSFDPDWSLGLALFAVVWFAAVGIGAYYFWSAVAR